MQWIHQSLKPNQHFQANCFNDGQESEGAIVNNVLDNFSEQVVSKELQKLEKKRATGPDEIPAEFWQTVRDTVGGLAWITELCNRCWTEERLPEDWHRADVMALHEKGPVDACDNYRPMG